MPGEPRTIVVAFETPGPTQSFPLPQGVVFDVEAVFIQVDATGAGGPVTAELTIAEQSGQVIAKKRQAETIDAGISGTATWALRLDDDGGAGSAPAVQSFLATITCPGGSDPAPGPGIVAAIDYIVTGHLLTGWCEIGFSGGAIDFGSGPEYAISLPLAPFPAGTLGVIGAGMTTEKTSPIPTDYMVAAIVESSGVAEFTVRGLGLSGPVGPANPFGFGAGDFIYRGPVSYYLA